MLFAPNSLHFTRRSCILYLLRPTWGTLSTTPTSAVSSFRTACSSAEGVVTGFSVRRYGGKVNGGRKIRRGGLHDREAAGLAPPAGARGELGKGLVALVPQPEEVERGENGDRGSLCSVETLLANAANQAMHLHRKMAAEKHQPWVGIGEAMRSSSTHSSAEKIERRRKKWTVAESEFDVGITERLFPEIRRLAALHELHYGDAVMREVDSSTYFSTTHTTAMESTWDDDDAGETMLTDADFLNFEVERQEVVGGTVSSKAAASGSSSDPLDTVQGSKNALGGGEKAFAHGLQTPWFSPPGGVAQLEPLPPEDLLCLLKFLMYLRQQKLSQLSVSLQAKVAATEKLLHLANCSEQRDNNTVAGRATHISLEDVMVYLDTAPSPVLGFTEDLPPRESPAFVFVLYTENVSLQNAIGHMAALFGAPQRAFLTCTAAAKMSCCSVICAVAPNLVRRQHLLLLNTMRHPGFVLRVGSVQEVKDPGQAASLFGDLAHWKPLHEVEILLRRISCRNRHELEHRLRAIKDVGAVFFCANREASLARAATDVLHGFYKSALLNALYRRNAPLELRHFVKRPNIITAARARRVSADPTIRQALKSFEATKGNWEQTVGMIPYVWRRRWLNALRCTVWNVMASRRLAADGGKRRVLPGDVVLRPEYRTDAHRRMIPTVKAEHVMIVRDDEEARLCSMEDVYIPFLRGSYSDDLFAPESTNHPIMTRTNMLKLLRELHAPQLLLGMSDACRHLMDVRCDSAPLLFRRFLMRPISMSFTVLEDKPPVKSVHFDAARLLLNDRLRQQRFLSCHSLREPNYGENESAAPPSPSFLVPQSVVLDQTTIGARLMSGVMAEEFFTPADRSDYVALGHVTRKLDGDFVAAAPQTSDDFLGPIDRLFSVHIHAVLRHGMGALAQLLREYFILGGVEAETDSALQHKVHRMRRELDRETQRLTAPSFCRACYSRCHDALSVCAEYQHKHGKHLRNKLREKEFQQLQMPNESLSSLVGTLAAPTVGGGSLLGSSGTITPSNGCCLPSNERDIQGGSIEERQVQLELELLLRRRSAGQKWGVHLTSSLVLTSVEDVSLIVEGQLRGVNSKPCDGVFLGRLCEELLLEGCQGSCFSSSGDADPHISALCHFFAIATTGNTNTKFAHLLNGVRDGVRLCNISKIFSTSSPPSPQPLAGESERELESEHPGNTRSLIRSCVWALRSINDDEVVDRRHVAALFMKIAKQREVRLRFRTSVNVGVQHKRGSSSDEGICADAEAGVLPSVAELTLLREEGEGSSESSSWGVMVDKNSLTVLNLSDLVQKYGLVGDQGPLVPPIPSGVDPGAADGKYVLRAINDVSVTSQRDVDECMAKQTDVSRNGSSGRGTALRLQLELFRGNAHKSVVEVDTTPPTIGKQKNETTPNPATREKDEITLVSTSSVDEEVGSVTTADSGLTPLTPCSPQCVPLTPAQLQRSVFTIAINRSADSPEGRWGIRVQRGTRRVQFIQHNQYYSFQVYTAKRSQAVRIADNLRRHSSRKSDPGTEEGDNGELVRATGGSGRSVTTSYSHFVYIISGVNYRHVSNNEELRSSLAEAGRSGGESVVLHVQQYRLAYIALLVERRKVGPEGAFEPVGLCISKDMVIKSVVAGSAIARAILSATHESCSLRSLIVDEQSGGEEHNQAGNVDAAEKRSSPVRTWQFDLDEDKIEECSLSNTRRGSGTAPKGVSTPTTAEKGPTAHWNMVDGVALCAAHRNTEAPCSSESGARFVWRVLYAARAGPLREPRDLARAFAGSIDEDTIFVQQCVVDE